MTYPNYDGTYNADDRLVAPWYIEGWTSQQAAADSIQVTPEPFGPSPLPGTLVDVQVTGEYFDFDRNPLSGFLTFLMNDSFTLTSNSKSYRMPARYAGRDNSFYPGGQNNYGSGRIFIRGGQMSVTLFATDNANITTDSGNPLTYHVVEHFLGGQQFDISVPEVSVSPADLYSLMVANSAAPYAFDPASPLTNDLAG